MENLFQKLEYAKKAVISMIEHDGVSVDFHSLSYWAGEVERLRTEIKNKL